jgi:hypothetical protein
MNNAEDYMMLVRRFNTLSMLMMKIKHTMAQVDTDLSEEQFPVPLSAAPRLSRRQLLKTCRALNEVQNQLQALHKNLVQSSQHPVDV